MGCRCYFRIAIQNSNCSQITMTIKPIFPHKLFLIMIKTFLIAIKKNDSFGSPFLPLSALCTSKFPKHTNLYSCVNVFWCFFQTRMFVLVWRPCDFL